MSSIWSGPKLPPLPLPPGLTERQVASTAAGLSFHIIEAGFTERRDRPLLLLLHGYPELAFSWRKIMPALAAAGYYVVAVDQRGYGRTVGWDNSSFQNTDMAQFAVSTLVGDMVALVNRLGCDRVRCVIGHDFGAVSAASCAMMRPDLFTAVITMSHPFTAPPARQEAGRTGQESDVHADLARLDPPRKHYKWYNSTAAANFDWCNPRQGMHSFLRGYFHLKSGDWPKNNPRPLKGWTAAELAKMPEYYIMQLSQTMPEAVAANMAGEDASKTKRWLSDAELDVYVQEWSRTGFQGGLNWYRGAATNPMASDSQLLFAGARIAVPSKFISGRLDWGNYQQPGAIESLAESFADFRGVEFIERAGHWPQQEQPEKVVDAILSFLGGLRRGDSRL